MDKRINILINDINNLDIDKKRKLITVAILAVVLIIILSVIALIIIWSNTFNPKYWNRNTVTKEETSLGTYKYVTYSKEKVIKKYLDIISKKLSTENKDEIYSMFSEDYLKHTGYNKETLYNYLVKTGLISNNISYNKYTYSKYDLFGNVYEATVSTAGGTIENKIIIIETSPNKFKISLDNYIGKYDVPIVRTKNGIKLTINSIEEYSTRSIYSISLTNVLNNQVILNNKYDYEILYAKNSSNGTSVRTSNLWLSGERIVLEPSITTNAMGIFESSSLDGSSIDTIVIKGIYNTVTFEEQEIEFKIN